MTSDMSRYQAVKIWITEYVPLERDTVHGLIGAVIVALVLLLSQRPVRFRAFAVALAVSFVVGCAMEFADRRDDIASLGNWRWRASVLDILRTIGIPLAACIVVGGRYLWRKG